MAAHAETGIHKGSATPDVRGWFVIFALSFLVFMAIALAGQLLGMQWRAWLPGAESAKSLFGGVKAAVWTFMAHLT
jgi:light-harvesting complex 1 beta chain